MVTTMRDPSMIIKKIPQIAESWRARFVCALRRELAGS